MKNKSKYKNSLRDNYILPFPREIVEKTNLASFIKFNFKYLDFSQNDKGFRDFATLSNDQRLFVFNKLKDFSGDTKTEWMKKHVGGKDSHVLKFFNSGYPKDTSASRPTYVPSDVDWAEFRLDGGFRLIGFFVSSTLEGKEIRISGVSYHLDSNTFYVVFIDPEHIFCPSQKKGT